MVPRLHAMKLISQTDAETFARYCRDFARWLKLQERLDKEGETYEIQTASGVVIRPHPAFMMCDRLDRKLESFEDRFGLNPAERQRLFAQRSALGAPPDLFGSAGSRTDSKPQSAPNHPRPNVPTSPVGFLN